MYSCLIAILDNLRRIIQTVSCIIFFPFTCVEVPNHCRFTTYESDRGKFLCVLKKILANNNLLNVYFLLHNIKCY